MDVMMGRRKSKGPKGSEVGFIERCRWEERGEECD